VRFVAGTNSTLNTPLSESTDAVTRGTVTETQGEQGLQMAPLGEVSLVTEQDFRRVDTVTNDVERDLSAHLASATDDSPPTSNEPDHVPSVGDGVLPEPKPDGSDRGEGTELLSQISICAQDNSFIISKQSAATAAGLSS